jgi:ABC-type dipeptide/oligopeptide/nickel transport system permease subunit
MRRRTSFRAGLAIVIALCALAVFGPFIARHDPFTSQFDEGLSPALGPAPPSFMFWLGTDRLFRDEFARVVTGLRFSLVIGAAATLVATVVGGLFGLVAGYFAQHPVHLARTRLTIPIDAMMMRLVDVGLAFPFLLLVMAMGAVFENTNTWTVLFALGATSWLGTARIVRAKVIEVSSLDFIVASRALGQGTFAVIGKHVLPNVIGPLTVLASLSVGQMILAESVLSYLGAGLAPPTPTLGHMLFEGQDLVGIAPWHFWTPGVVIVLCVLGFNLIGLGLSEPATARGPR